MGCGGGECSILPKRLCVHITDASSLVLLLFVQGAILNQYLISHYKDSGAPYLLFVLDFACVFTFIGTLSTAYTHLRTTAEAERGLSFRPKRAPPRSRFGALPLCYGSWILYASALAVKAGIIYESGLAEDLSEKQLFGPQLLKVTLASASFVFLLLVEGHSWAPRGSPRRTFVTSVCARTAIELFDTVAILSILSDGPGRLSDVLEDVILYLAVINLFLPTLALYQLSVSDFAASRTSGGLALLYSGLHLVLLDGPYLGMRIYLWVVHRDRASLFLMKNALSILLTVRSLYPDLVAAAARPAPQPAPEVFPLGPAPKSSDLR